MAPQDPVALKNLETLVQTASSLIKDLVTTIHNQASSLTETTTKASTTPSTSSASPPNALHLARDSASLIRAHATKLSLLIINEPFTPTAVSAVLSDLLSSGAIPGLATGAQACDSSLYTALFQKEILWRSERALKELHDLLSKIPKDGKALTGADKVGGPAGGGGGGGGGQNGGMGSLPATGLVWAACDDVVALSGMGVGGFFVQKMDQWRDTLDDILQELKDWGDQDPTADNEDEDEDEEETPSQAHDPNQTVQDMVDDLMNTNQAPIPLSDPHSIRPRLTSSLKNLRLVILFYQAATKRRIRKLPSFPLSSSWTTSTDTAAERNPRRPSKSCSELPSRLDDIARQLAKLPNAFEDLAFAFYDMEPERIDDVSVQCFLDAFAASELLSRNWDGEEDEFTQWAQRFCLEIKKA